MGRCPVEGTESRIWNLVWTTMKHLDQMMVQKEISRKLVLKSSPEEMISDNPSCFTVSDISQTSKQKPQQYTPELHTFKASLDWPLADLDPPPLKSPHLFRYKKPKILKKLACCWVAEAVQFLNPTRDCSFFCAGTGKRSATCKGRVLKQEVWTVHAALTLLVWRRQTHSQRQSWAILKTMINNSCPRISLDFSERFLPPVYISVFIIGLTANGWGLQFLRHNWKKLGYVDVFVLNLGISDILYLLTLPFLVVYYFMESRWMFGETFCKITRFCFNLNLYGSIGFLTCISVYRYLAIVHPMRVKGRITVTHSVMISAMVWLLVSVQSLPDMFYSKHLANNTHKCFDTTNPESVESYLKYSVGWTLTGFCIPLLITLGCYGHVIIFLCHTNTTDKILKQRCLKLLFILILLFSVCYIPYHVLKNLNLWSRVLSKQGICSQWSNGVYIARQISRGLVCLNSALNPLVYLHGTEDILARFRQLLERTRSMFRSLMQETSQDVSQLSTTTSQVPLS